MIHLSLSLVAVTLGALSLFVLRSCPSRPTNRWFAVFGLLLTVWTLAIAGVYSGAYSEAWGRLTFVTTSFVPPAFLGFVRSFPAPGTWPAPAIVRWSLVVSGVLAVLCLSTPHVVHDFTMTGGEWTRKTGSLYSLFALHFIVSWVASVVILVAKWLRARGRSRIQLRYVTVGLAVSSGLGMSTNLLLPLATGRSTYAWVGPHFALFFIAIVAHAIIRHRLMDLRLVIHQRVTRAVATVLSMVPAFLAIISLVWPFLADRIGPAEAMASLFLIAAVTAPIPAMRDIAGRLLDGYLYRSRPDFQRTVRDVSRLLNRPADLKLTVSSLNDMIAAATGSEATAIYIAEDSVFSREALQKRQGAAFDAPDKLSGPILQAFAERRDVLGGDLAHTAMHGSPDLVRALHELGWAVVLPIAFEDQVLGAIAVGPKLSGEPFHPQDLDLLVTLANQAGIAVRNAQLHAQAVLASKHIDGIVSTIESGVVAVDAAGRVTMFSPRAERLTGLARDGVLGRAAGALPSPLAELLLATLADGRAHTRGDATLTDGTTTRPVTCTTSPLRGPGGDPLGAVAVLSDLTTLKSLEAERRRAERLARLQVLAPRLAHEIKNPLVAIKTFAQLVGRRRDQAFVDHFNRIVTREIERMERLLGRLRTLSLAGDGPRGPMDVRGPIREALEFLQPSFEGRSVTVRASLGSEPRIVIGNPGEIEELFLNLLTNALEATPPHGLVSVDVAADQTSVTVSVADTGPGIPEALLERIFDPFVTTKRGGTGIGLTICAGIAAAHRAKLRAANRPAGGAIFTMELPLADPDSART